MKYNIKSIKEKVTKISDEEHVNREEALTAIAVLNQLRVFSKGDYLLYLASINLLNRFAKLNVGVLNNRFRYYLYPIIYQIMQEKPNNINIYSKINYKRHQIPFLIIDIEDRKSVV
jgi:DNA polymerase III epsilon subunit-like protein